MAAKQATVLPADIRDRVKELRRVPARDLIPNDKNWRKHPARQRTAMMAVLQEIGYASGLLAREDADGKLVLIDGHLRAEVTPDTIVPVLVLDVDEKEADKILATLDPLAEMAACDAEAFRELAGSIDGLIPDFRDLIASLSPESVASDSEDHVPDVPETPVSQPGDLWILGPHRILCGDCSNASDVARVLDGKEPLLMVTDPPYGIELDSEWRDRAGLNGCGPAEPSYMKKRTKGHKNTSISSDTRADWSEAFALVPSLEVA